MLNLLRTSLTAKVVVAIGTSLVVMATVGFAFFDSFLRNQIEKSMKNSTAGVGAVIVAGLERSMLSNDQDSIGLMLDKLSHQDDIVRAYVVNNKSVISFSTIKKDLNKQLSKSVPECMVCHELGVGDRPRAVHLDLESGEEVIRNITPIYNKPECESCHDANERVLGILLLDIDSGVMHAQQRLHRIVAVLSGGIMGGLLIAIIWYLMARLVIRPLADLSKTAVRVGNGELISLPPEDREDIIGLLHNSMSNMVSNLKEIATRIINASNRVSDASEEMTRFSKEIKQGATLEKEAVEETASSSQEIANTLKNILSNISTLSSSSLDTSNTINEMESSINLIGSSVDELMGSIEGTASSVNELAASTSQVANNVNSLSENTASTAEVIEEINMAISQATSSARDTEALSEDVIRSAEQGAEAVQKSVDGINRIQHSSREAVEVISKLGKTTLEIGSILTVISDVTDQTNLLALNAAIIAAQAGAHGKGFGVVAGEIKKLAERTGRSTNMIKELVKNVQSESRQAVEAMEAGYKDVEVGVELTRKGGEALEHIMTCAQKSTEKVREITSSMALQAREMSEITGSVADIAKVVKQISSATTEQAGSNKQIVKACEEMSRIANHVQRAAQEQTAGSRIIVQSVANINDMIGQIELAVGELSGGNDDVVTSMNDINDLATKFEAHVSELENVAISLSQEGVALKEAVQKFKMDDD